MRSARLLFAGFLLTAVGCASILGIEDTTDEATSTPDRDATVDTVVPGEDASILQDDGSSSNEIPVDEDASTFADVETIDAQVTTCAENGLVARWKIDEGNATVVADCSGNKLHGIATNGTWTSNGADGGALKFTGTGWVGFGNPALLRITGAYTLSMWVRSDSNTVETEYLFGKTSSPADNGYRIALLGHNPNEVVMATASSANYFNVTGGNVPAGSWRHIVGIYRPSGTNELYMNGTKIGSAGGAPATLIASNVEARLGARFNGANGFNGAISDVRVYNRVLSAAEITALATR